MHLMQIAHLLEGAVDFVCLDGDGEGNHGRIIDNEYQKEELELAITQHASMCLPKIMAKQHMLNTQLFPGKTKIILLCMWILLKYGLTISYKVIDKPHEWFIIFMSLRNSFLILKKKTKIMALETIFKNPKTKEGLVRFKALRVPGSVAETKKKKSLCRLLIHSLSYSSL
ncbi:hypothetical protein ACJX0J_015601, partial [Zea mays]